MYRTCLICFQQHAMTHAEIEGRSLIPASALDCPNSTSQLNEDSRGDLWQDRGRRYYFRHVNDDWWRVFDRNGRDVDLKTADALTMWGPFVRAHLVVPFHDIGDTATRRRTGPAVRWGTSYSTLLMSWSKLSTIRSGVTYRSTSTGASKAAVPIGRRRDGQCGTRPNCDEAR